MVIEFCSLKKLNVLMPKAVSDIVSHSTLTGKSMPLVRDTFKYTVLLASSMSTEVALKETNGLRKAGKGYNFYIFKYISYWYHILNTFKFTKATVASIHKSYTAGRLDSRAQNIHLWGFFLKAQI